MEEKSKKLLIKIWKGINAALALFFLFLMLNAYIQIFFFKNTDKSYYYFGTIFVIPLITCLIVVFGWDLDKAK